MKFLPAAALWIGVLGAAAPAAAQGDARSDPDPTTSPYVESLRKPIPPPARQPQVMDWGGLRPDYGREETYYFCSPCHSETRIKAARKSRAEWATTIDRILAEHPYEPLDPQTREVILDYLAAQYGPQVP
jgi:hypothetical protein